MPSVRAGIEQRASARAGEATLAVVIKPTDVVLGSFQGAFRYTPGALSLVSVTIPDGDGTRVFNRIDSTGVIRFAGFTMTGFRSTDVLVLVVKSGKPLADAGLAVDLTVASDLQGTVLPASQLISTRGLSGSTGRAPGMTQ
jgi:hypothetical protein